MFVFDRSAFAVVLPLALLVAVVLWSNRGAPRPAPQTQLQATAAAPAATPAAAQPAEVGEVLAANLPSR